MGVEIEQPVVGRHTRDLEAYVGTRIGKPFTKEMASVLVLGGVRFGTENREAFRAAGVEAEVDAQREQQMNELIVLVSALGEDVDDLEIAARIAAIGDNPLDTSHMFRVKGTVWRGAETQALFYSVDYDDVRTGSPPKHYLAVNCIALWCNVGGLVHPMTLSMMVAWVAWLKAYDNAGAYAATKAKLENEAEKAGVELPPL